MSFCKYITYKACHKNSFGKSSSNYKRDSEFNCC